MTSSQPSGYRGRPTVYKGIRMRSRLETRWARAFDAAHIEWEYEPECFAAETLGRHSEYLPDFRLNGRIYVEIKPPLIGPEIHNVHMRMMNIRANVPDAPLWLIHMHPEWVGGYSIDMLATGAKEWRTISCGVRFDDDDPIPFAAGL